MNLKTTWATPEDVLEWLKAGVFRVDQGGQVFKGDRELAVRQQTRKRCALGDARVDLWHAGKRRSINVSHLVWMSYTRSVVPLGWEIHHRDEDLTNNSWDNLVCVHPMDHIKFHSSVKSEEIPF